MFALLGSIPFQIIDSPQRFNAGREYDYAQHRVIEGTPRLQWVGDGLESIDLEMMLHRSFTDPGVRMLALSEAAGAHQALPLIFGNGEFRGYYVIESLSTLSRQLSDSGDTLAVTLRVRLRESIFSIGAADAQLPNFTPLAISAAAGSAAGAEQSPGVSALLSLFKMFGPGSILRPEDVPASLIVRSAA